MKDSTFDYEKFHEEHLNALMNDPRSNEELVNIALTSEDEAAEVNAIVVLWHRPAHEILQIGQRLCSSDEPKERILGTRILGQGYMADPTRRFPSDELLAILLPLLDREQEPDVLFAACKALGEIDDPRSIERLIRLKSHPDEEVRYGVVGGLLEKDDEQAVAALIELSADSDTDVRDWATFGLARMEEFDTPAVRSALWARVGDEDDDTRGEALVGLALRGDTKVIEPLIEELESAGEDAGPTLFKAASAAGKTMNDPRICAALQKLQALPDHFGYSNELAEALARCSPPMHS